MYKYLVYFRLRRGGTGIPFALAFSEFERVFEPFKLHVTREMATKRRIWVDLNLPPDDIAQHANHLAYTEAILSQDIEPYRGETLTPVPRGRWFTGWMRRGEHAVYQREIFVQNLAKRRHESPDILSFPIKKKGQLIDARGYHTRRALSAMDARYLFNIAKPDQNTTILDPFAGFGGIVREAHRRKLSIFAFDNDRSLAPGLTQLVQNHCTIADAQSLPLASHTIDTIITEPPFHPRYQQAVANALPELQRILTPKGKLILLIAQNMLKNIQTFFEKTNWQCEQVSTVPRDHGLKCPTLIIQRSH